MHFEEFSHPNQVQRMLAYTRTQAEKIKVGPYLKQPLILSILDEF